MKRLGITVLDLIFKALLLTSVKNPKKVMVSQDDYNALMVLASERDVNPEHICYNTETHNWECFGMKLEVNEHGFITFED
jgi:hypothetical protein